MTHPVDLNQMVLIDKLLLGRVGIQLGVRIQPPLSLALVAIHVVPPVTGEQSLVEEGAVGAQEGASLLAFPSIVAHMVGLAASLRVGVHSRDSWNIVTTEGCVGHRMVDGVIVSRHSRNVLKLLLLLGFLLLLVHPLHDDRSMIIVDLLVLGLAVFSDWHLAQGFVVQLRENG